MLPELALIAAPIILLLHVLPNLHKLPTWFRRLHSTRSVTVAPLMAADYLLFLFLSCRNKSETIGDLTEEFHEDIMPAFGLKAARFRCWKKALSAIVERNPIVREFLIGGGVLKAGEVIWKLFAGQQASAPRSTARTPRRCSRGSGNSGAIVQALRARSTERTFSTADLRAQIDGFP